MPMDARAPRQEGFTYLGLLFAVVIIGLMLTVVARVWQTTVQREHERQLLWIGHAYRMAISSYFALGHKYPVTLQDLLSDERFPVPKHHLRRLYPDPMTGRADWTLIPTATRSGILGVASSSHAAPIKRDGFDVIDMGFKGAKCYCDWTFVYTPFGAAVPVLPVAAPAVPPTQGPSPCGPTAAPGIPIPLPAPSPVPGPGLR